MSASWLIWRQTRVTAVAAISLLGAFAIAIVVNGLRLHHAYAVGLVRCRAGGDCADLQKQLFHNEGTVVELINLTVLAPALIGIFLGAPLLAHEFELATNKLVWTQTIGRGRWLLTKLGWLALFTCAWSGAIAALVTWWSGPLNELGHHRFFPDQFDIQGIVPIAYAVFAFALASAAGALIRQTLAAAAISFGGFVGVRFLVRDYLRQRYLTPLTTPLKPGAHPVYAAQGNWTLNVRTNLAGRPKAHGHYGQGLAHLSHSSCHFSHFACLTAAGIRQLFTYQPATRYWTFQSLETVLFGFLAATLVIGTSYIAQRADG